MTQQSIFKRVSVCFANCSILCAFLATTPAIAGDCPGILTEIISSQNGRVTIIGTMYPDGAPRDICNLNTPYASIIPTSVCRVWLANLLMAHATGKRVTILYFNTNTCSGQGVWDSAAAPWSVSVNN